MIIIIILRLTLCLISIYTKQYNYIEILIFNQIMNIFVSLFTEKKITDRYINNFTKLLFIYDVTKKQNKFVI